MLFRSAVSVALYLYPLDAVPHVVRSDHAPKGSSMKLVIPVQMPKSPSSTNRLYLRSRDLLEKRALDCECMSVETKM